MNSKLCSMAAANGCTQTIAVKQPCDCNADLGPDEHHIPIIFTFGGTSYAACYDVNDSTEITTLCIPASVPIGNGGTYTAIFTSPSNGSTITQTGVILTGGGEIALCQKTDHLTQKASTIF